MKHCPKCKNEISKNQKFCKKCGAHLAQEKSVLQKELVLSKKAIFYTVAVIVILLLIFFFIYPGAKSTEEVSSATEVTQKTGTSEKTVAKSYCGDKICKSGEDSNSCCIDCGCPDGYSCNGEKCKKLASCGNNICEEGESSLNCCRDCGCSTGETCQNGVCVVLKPELSASFTQTTASYSVTFLKAKGESIGTITLQNTGNDDAQNTKIVLSSLNGYFSDKTVEFGTIDKENSKTANIDLNFLSKALEVTTDEDITIKAVITFYNSANKIYNSEENFKMHITGRNYMTWAQEEMIASWVTPTQPSISEFARKATSGLAAGLDNSDPIVQKMAARWLFEAMRAYGVHYVNDAHSSADYIEFPLETLKNQGGDCDDNAILYATLLESIGLNSFLVLVPGHIFSGYTNSEGYAVPIETTASNFDSALSFGSAEYEQYKDSATVLRPNQLWNKYPSVNLPETSSLNMPAITKQKGECGVSWTFSQGWIAKMPVTFTNSGNAPGAGCAAIIIYNNARQKVSDDLSCWTINPNETKNEEYIADITLGNLIEGYSCVGY